MVFARSIKKVVLLCFAFSALAMPMQSQAGLWDTFSKWYTQCSQKNSVVTGICTVIAAAIAGAGLGKLIVYIKNSCKKQPQKKDTPRTTPKRGPQKKVKKSEAPPARHGISVLNMMIIDTLSKKLTDLEALINAETASPLQISFDHLPAKIVRWRLALDAILSQVESMQMRATPIQSKLETAFSGIQAIIKQFNLHNRKNIFTLFSIPPGYESVAIVKNALNRWHEGMQRHSAEAQQFAKKLHGLIMQVFQNELDIANYTAYINNDAGSLEIRDTESIATLKRLNDQSQALHARIAAIAKQNQELAAHAAAQRSSRTLREELSTPAELSESIEVLPADPLRAEHIPNNLAASGVLPSASPSEKQSLSYDERVDQVD